MISFPDLYSKAWKTLTDDTNALFMMLGALALVQFFNIIPSGLIQYDDIVLSNSWVPAHPFLFLGFLVLFSIVSMILLVLMEYFVSTILVRRVRQEPFELSKLFSQGNFWQYILTMLLILAIVIGVTIAATLVILILFAIIAGLLNAILPDILLALIGFGALVIGLVGLLVLEFWVIIFAGFMSPVFFSGGYRYIDVITQSYRVIRGRGGKLFARLWPIFLVFILMGIFTGILTSIVPGILYALNGQPMSQTTIFWIYIGIMFVLQMTVVVPTTVFMKTLFFELYNDFLAKTRSDATIDTSIIKA